MFGKLIIGERVGEGSLMRGIAPKLENFVYALRGLGSEEGFSFIGEKERKPGLVEEA